MGSCDRSSGAIVRKPRRSGGALRHRGRVDQARLGFRSTDPGVQRLNWGPFRGLKSASLPENDFKKSGTLAAADDRLNTAVSHAGFGPGH